MISICRSFAALALLARLAAASCECGYSVNSTGAPEHVVFTEILETNFLVLPKMSETVDWAVAKYRKGPDPSRDATGRVAEARNVIPNPVKDDKDYSSDGKNGGEPGLQLICRGGDPKDGVVPVGEIKTRRNDMLYGSFRASMAVSAVNGTAGAFFFYHNDTQIIDMEFLSKQLSEADDKQPVNLVLHSAASKAPGSDASHTPSYKLHPLPFAPSKGFHEYRFDWTPGRVSFFADGAWLADITQNVPEHPGSLLFAHWGNGPPGWTAGPPDEDATLTVAYAKAYFNSSSDANAEYKKRCENADAETAVCKIPEVKGAPDGNGKKRAGYFFTDQKDMVHEPKVTVKAEAAQSTGTAEEKKSAAGAGRQVGGAAVVAALAAWVLC
ncbi:concanavalin A-like lectin/glucanase domain-containing protein [Geopyxis carbonaria]|nr:concanavalin A-like lectin/glucanase domain-containing protein [Geopyxis carbonaria]